jgi:hypothetical protein
MHRTIGSDQVAFHPGAETTDRNMIFNLARFNALAAADTFKRIYHETIYRCRCAGRGQLTGLSNPRGKLSDRDEHPATKKSASSLFQKLPAINVHVLTSGYF